MATIQLKDFYTIEKNLNGKEYLFTSQDDKTRKVELDKVKEFIIGTGQLMTTDQSSIINAINEIQQVILNQSGGAGQLQTELDKIKADYVSKTNDLLKSYTVGTSDNSLVPTVQALTDVYNILKNLIDVINKNIGDKSKLATIDSSTLVNAINEINTRIQTAETFCNEVESMIGGQYDASTEGTLVDRIKALETNIATNQVTWEDKYTKAEIDNKISQVVSNMDWKESVATYNDIATTYPNPQDGWTVNVKDTDITYRWDGSKWIEISANAIPLATSSIDGKMSKTDKSFLDTVKGLWNSVTTHIGDAVKHITSAERTLWNTVSNKLDKTGDTMTGTLNINNAGELRKTNDGKQGVILFGNEEIAIRKGTSPDRSLIITETDFTFGGNEIYHKGNLTKVSQLNNDAGYITQSDVDTSQNHTHANKATLDKITEANLTSWNGKLDKTGGTVTGRIICNGGISVKSLRGGTGTAGYAYMARITIASAYQNQPITFDIQQRNRYGSIIIQFQNVNSHDPLLSKFVRRGNIEAYIVKSSACVWDLYVKKEEAYDVVDVISMGKGEFMTLTTIEWGNSTVTALPTGYVTAGREYIDLAVERANRDSDGNTINTTYIKKDMTWADIEG